MKLTLKKSIFGFSVVTDAGLKYFELLQLGDEVEAEVDDSCEKPKTDTQRAALHVWLELMAGVMNEAGFDMTVFLRDHAKEGIHVPWTKTSIKEVFYKPTLAAMTGKVSTEHMNTVEPSQICDVIGCALSQRLGVTPPAWPTRFNQGEQSRKQAAA
jgi:hypothetical protein